MPDAYSQPEPQCDITSTSTETDFGQIGFGEISDIVSIYILQVSNVGPVNFLRFQMTNFTNSDNSFVLSKDFVEVSMDQRISWLNLLETDTYALDITSNVPVASNAAEILFRINLSNQNDNSIFGDNIIDPTADLT